ncbi:hypothetical protein VCUG_01926 [Vavraia culicis subsp. floridensis]|uniref:Uncharacterized protein n=1 Tax=Vavraia culicis (isolate floridensis) TaxID=948595 RepID=L2GSF3_VAVCU|nr:uncharacterized protein VCUG_01926 [Vavraia culicis subsp. floridensis]ELA46596.1 hypothetical protein VCUG_01926 [Vavraia culicis subsp. floridensis]
MKYEEYEKLLNTLGKTDKIAQNLNQIYKKMESNTQNTPTTVLQTFERYSIPKKNLEYAIKFHEDYIKYCENVNESVLVIKDYKKANDTDIKKDLEVIEAYENIKNSNKNIKMYKSIGIVKTKIESSETALAGIYNSIRKRFFLLVKENMLIEVDGLNRISTFLITYGEKSEIAEKYMQTYFKEFNFRDALEDTDAFVKRVADSSKLFNDIREMNIFLFDTATYEFLNKNMINYLREDMKTNIMRFMDLIERRKNLKDIFMIIDLYDVAKINGISLLGCMDCLLHHLIRYIENVNQIDKKFEVESFVVFTTKVINSLNSQVAQDYVEKYGENLKVKEQDELKDKILLTLYMKIKHLSLNENELNKNVYLLNNINYIMKTRNAIGDKMLFDDIQIYKKGIISYLRDESANYGGNCTAFIDNTLNFFTQTKIPNETRNYVLENVKKIFKDLNKRAPYNGDFEKILKRLDNLELS